jgi:hypothetical protein
MDGPAQFRLAKNHLLVTKGVANRALGVTISRSIQTFGRAARRSSGWRTLIQEPVLVAPAPEAFRNAGRISALTPAFARRAVDGEYWLVDDGHTRLLACSSAARTVIYPPQSSSRSMRISAYAPMQHGASGVSLPADGTAVRRID